MLGSLLFALYTIPLANSHVVISMLMISVNSLSCDLSVAAVVCC